MNYDALVEMLGAEGWFNLASVAQLSGEQRNSLRIQLYRWCKAGKLLPLRRGMYAFPARYSTKTINPAELSNRLYVPSYLSTHWALGYFGLIPEYVVTYTNVTSRVPRTFKNAFGSFRYQHVKAAAFFGYQRVTINERIVLLAEPEKALLDFWYLETGLWSEARMSEMRFQNFDIVNTDTLFKYAHRFDSPRLIKAANLWCQLAEAETKGTKEL